MIYYAQHIVLYNRFIFYSILFIFSFNNSICYLLIFPLKIRTMGTLELRLEKLICCIPTHKFTKFYLKPDFFSCLQYLPQNCDLWQLKVPQFAFMFIHEQLILALGLGWGAETALKKKNNIFIFIFILAQRSQLGWDKGGLRPQTFFRPERENLN